ncbi:MAG TPA: hypothetical protein VFQ60_01305 [Patescibacteria group bacterium]|nr:hypothetical protein [Patescibacteria group bacterium]
MRKEFGFAVVPFERDGYIHELISVKYLALKTEGEKSIPSPYGLSLNTNGIRNVNCGTKGAFLELVAGDGERFILLARRQTLLDRLRVSIPKLRTGFRRKFLEVFVRNADAAIKQYGDKAALLIY